MFFESRNLSIMIVIALLVIMPATFFLTPTVHDTALLGFIAVVFSAEKWKQKGGLTAAAGVSLILAVGHYLEALFLNIWTAFSIAAFYFLAGAVMGKTSKLRYEKKREFQEKNALFENSSSAIAVLDKEGNIEDVNDQFKNKFEFDLEDIEGMHLDDVLEMGKEGYADRSATEEFLSGKKNVQSGTRYSKDGEARKYLIQGVPIIVNEEVQGAYALYDDITELVSAREKITELHQIALDLSRSEKEEEIYQKTVEAAERILEFDLCVLDIVEDNKLKVKAISSEVDPDESKTVDLSEDESISIDVYKSQEPSLIKKLSDEKGVNPLQHKYESVLTVPIGEYGIFQAVAEDADMFDRLDLQMAELLVSHTRTALRELEAKKEMHYISFHDSLTDLYNRSYMEEELERLDTKRQLPISLIMCDVNGMKMVNDTYGHNKGDELLIKVASILESAVREEDIVARWAGDEFVILLPQTSYREGKKICERIIKEAEGVKLNDIPVSVAAGLATKNEIDEDIYGVLNAADDKMYQNKLAGGEEIEGELIENILDTLSTSSYETRDHTIRLDDLSQRLGSRIDLSEDQMEQLSLLANLHDIGKITISGDILDKEIALSKKEWEKVKKHSEKGYAIASATEKFAYIARDIHHHHERWDGCGYPEGLEGEEIPLLARIISITDAYDAMVNGRPYREPLSREEALKEIKRCAGSQFDPELADEFVNMFDEG